MKHRAVVQGRWLKSGLLLLFLPAISLVCHAGEGSSDVSVSGPLYVGCQGAARTFSIPAATRLRAGSVFVGWTDSCVDNVLEVAGGAELVVTDACSRPAACEIRSGTLWLDNGGVVSDSISVWSHSTLGGRGAVNATTLCEGTLAPGAPIGTLFHNGNLALSPSASSEFQIAGYALDSEIDRVTVNGRLCLAGSLQLSLENGFVPRAGDRFVIMTGSSISGSFADVLISNCPQDLAADVVIDDATVTVVFVGK